MTDQIRRGESSIRGVAGQVQASSQRKRHRNASGIATQAGSLQEVRGNMRKRRRLLQRGHLREMGTDVSVAQWPIAKTVFASLVGRQRRWWLTIRRDGMVGQVRMPKHIVEQMELSWLCMRKCWIQCHFPYKIRPSGKFQQWFRVIMVVRFGSGMIIGFMNSIDASLNHQSWGFSKTEIQLTTALTLKFVVGMFL